MNNPKKTIHDTSNTFNQQSSSTEKLPMAVTWKHTGKTSEPTYKRSLFDYDYDYDDSAEVKKATETKRRVGAHLKQNRVEKNISQEEATTLFGIPKRTWQHYEQGETLPPTDLLLKLYEQWNVDVVWLLFDTSF